MLHNQHIADLGTLLERKGIRKVIISPGSRNAPLIQLFTGNKVFKCYSIVDERSAGYVALGMARELNEAVVIVSTSGTAILNLSPAVAEAFHQHIPLVVLTADRPLERIKQFNNQVINQEAPYFNHSKGFIELPFEIRTETEEEQVLEAIDQLLEEAKAPEAGPVHVNVPLLEPLYDKLPEPLVKAPLSKNISAKTEGILALETDVLNRRIMLLAGMDRYEEKLGPFLSELSSRLELLVIAENISNLASGRFVANPELVLAGSSEAERETLAPELVITIGGQVVSKHLRLFIESLEHVVQIEISGNPLESLKGLLDSENKKGGARQNYYLQNWKAIEAREGLRASSYIDAAPFSTMTVVQKVLHLLPAQTTVHLGNSSIIRYSQLFPVCENLRYYSNRGTSGIDGSVSAAVGAAMVSEKLHVLLVGDLSFVYDSNALWNSKFPRNLKIVVINDGGGGIFRLLDGPDQMDFFEEFSVTHHPVSLELLSQSFGREYQRAGNMEEVVRLAKTLLDPDSSLSILEADTTGSENSRIFREFFKRNQ